MNLFKVYLTHIFYQNGSYLLPLKDISNFLHIIIQLHIYICLYYTLFILSYTIYIIHICKCLLVGILFSYISFFVALRTTYRTYHSSPSVAKIKGRHIYFCPPPSGSSLVSYNHNAYVCILHINIKRILKEKNYIHNYICLMHTL